MVMAWQIAEYTCADWLRWQVVQWKSLYKQWHRQYWSGLQVWIAMCRPEYMAVFLQSKHWLNYWRKCVSYTHPSHWVSQLPLPRTFHHGVRCGAEYEQRKSRHFCSWRAPVICSIRVGLHSPKYPELTSVMYAHFVNKCQFCFGHNLWN